MPEWMLSGWEHLLAVTCGNQQTWTIYQESHWTQISKTGHHWTIKSEMWQKWWDTWNEATKTGIYHIERDRVAPTWRLETRSSGNQVRGQAWSGRGLDSTHTVYCIPILTVFDHNFYSQWKWFALCHHMWSLSTNNLILFNLRWWTIPIPSEENGLLDFAELTCFVNFQRYAHIKYWHIFGYVIFDMPIWSDHFRWYQIIFFFINDLISDIYFLSYRINPYISTI